jgi:hypothetical protein
VSENQYFSAVLVKYPATTDLLQAMQPMQSSLYLVSATCLGHAYRLYISPCARMVATGIKCMGSQSPVWRPTVPQAPSRCCCALAVSTMDLSALAVSTMDLSALAVSTMDLSTLAVSTMNLSALAVSAMDLSAQVIPARDPLTDGRVF